MPALCRSVDRAILNGTQDMAAFCQCPDVSHCLPLSAIDEKLKRIIGVWDTLPERIRTEVEALCLEPASLDDSN